MRTIRDLDLDSYTRKAVEAGRLHPAQADMAAAEYRQFLLLVWANRLTAGHSAMIPTSLADQIWHEHILDSAAYRDFCDRVVDHYIDHRPGIGIGSPEHDSALEHTRTIHGAWGDGGFVTHYLGVEARSMRRSRLKTILPDGEVGFGISFGDGDGCGGD